MKSQTLLCIRYVIVFFFALGFNNVVRFLKNYSILFTAIEVSLILGGIIFTFGSLGNGITGNIGKKLILGGIVTFLAFPMTGLVGGETFLPHISFEINSVIGLIIVSISSIINIIGLSYIIDGMFDLIIYFTKNKGLYTKKKGRFIGGVFSGIGDSFKINPNILRVLSALIIFCTSSHWEYRIILLFIFSLFYALLWKSLPRKG